MNVEAFYVYTGDQSLIISTVRERLNTEVDELGLQAKAPLPSSYDPLIRNDPKRKIVVSPSDDHGWVTVLESKEVVDFTLAQRLSEKLQTKVIIVQLAETVGAMGMTILKNGIVISSVYSEHDHDPSGRIQRFMTDNNVKGPLLMFREAIRLHAEGWVAITR